MFQSIPLPQNEERPTVYADRLGQWYSAFTAVSHRKTQGQYFTPVPIADLMASLYNIQDQSVRILDPGAGTGILTCALCEHLAHQIPKPAQLTIQAVEKEPELAYLLQQTLNYLQQFLANKGISLAFTVTGEDFVLRYAGALKSGPTSVFDAAIINPPYFKLPKTDPRAQVAAPIVHGQPNIYALFMAIAASMLAPGGQFISITPRSFASGLYFRRFREYLFARIKPEHIHLFTSRRSTFKRDEVLQENIVLKAQRTELPVNDALVHVSSSENGVDLPVKTRPIPLKRLISSFNSGTMLFIPASSVDEAIIQLVQSWPGSLKAYGFEISTGPVVPFRAVPLLLDRGSLQTDAPLLWMQSIHPMKVHWPAKLRNKPQYLRICADTMPLLVPNQNYVLLRRVSAKEDHRRITAAPFSSKAFYTPWIGFENHLNYIHRPGGNLTEDEAWGLAALYSSTLFDTYFRAMSGNTQVSATELRSIPLPDLSILTQLGYQIKHSTQPEQDIETLIHSMFGYNSLDPAAYD